MVAVRSLLHAHSRDCGGHTFHDTLLCVLLRLDEEQTMIAASRTDAAVGVPDVRVRAGSRITRQVQVWTFE
jgi:hypothetical protein